MDPSDVFNVAEQSVWLLLKSSLPIMLVAMAVGVVISLVQALTQIQEVTISFVPKIVAVFFSILVFMPFIGSLFLSFSNTILEIIQKI